MNDWILIAVCGFSALVGVLVGICIKGCKFSFLRDMIGVLYEGDYMSLARLSFFTVLIMFVLAWIGEQFFDKPYANFSILVAALFGTDGGYLLNKFLTRRSKK